jgi:hypothetical protein
MLICDVPISPGTIENVIGSGEGGVESTATVIPILQLKGPYGSKYELCVCADTTFIAPVVPLAVIGQTTCVDVAPPPAIELAANGSEPESSTHPAGN